MLHRIFIQLLSGYSIFFFAAANFLATSCAAFLVKTALRLQITTQVCSLTLSLICPLIGFQQLSSFRFKLSSRLNQRIFWISSLQVLNLQAVISQIKFSLSWIFTTKLVELFVPVFSEISFIRIELSVSLKRMTPNTVPSTLLWHRLRNTDHRTFSFFSLSV